jgi:HEPN domain-containing protein
MASRSRDWIRLAERDLEVARNTCADAHYDWSCFAAQQAAEKALKAVYHHHHAEGWGHVLRILVEGIVDREPGLADLLERAKILDKYYIPTRYPNGLDAGAPADAYTRTEAEQAIAHAEDITRFCKARCSAAG